MEISISLEILYSLICQVFSISQNDKKKFYIDIRPMFGFIHFIGMTTVLFALFCHSKCILII